jgi:bifunctional DNase/RNase
MRATSTQKDGIDAGAAEALTDPVDPGSSERADDAVMASAEGESPAHPREPSAAPDHDPTIPEDASGELDHGPADLVEDPGEVQDEPPGLDEGSPGDEDLDGNDEAEELDPPAFLDDLETGSSDMDFEEDPLLAPPEMSQMLFVDVVLLLPATHPVVVLQEADSPFRELRIPIGGAEGIAIGYAARGIATPRPLTHELFARVLEEFGMTIDVVRITDVNGAAFSAEIVVSGPQGVREIDCRPSDAIALALRQRLPVPIVASPIVLAIAGTDPLGAN